jgi:isoleucyl-tRNA synthetase
VLHECLVTITQLLAPLCPFVSDAMFQNLAATSESVHLGDWPAADESAIDQELESQMFLARHYVSLGLSARTESRLKVRQPLPRALVLVPGEGGLEDAIENEIADALNVKRLEVVNSLEGLLDYSVVPNFRALGPKVGKLMPKVKAQLAELDGATVRRAFDVDGSFTLTVDGSDVLLTPDDVEVHATSHEEFALAQDGGFAVALDTRVDHELALAGLARETIRLLNDRRKADGLQISDRIVAWLQADGSLREALDAHREWIAREVLAVELHVGDVDGSVTEVAVGDAVAGVRIEKV